MINIILESTKYKHLFFFQTSIRTLYTYKIFLLTHNIDLPNLLEPSKICKFLLWKLTSELCLQIFGNFLS